MKRVPLFGAAIALVLTAAPVQADTLANISAEAASALPTPLVAGLILLALGLAVIMVARRKLNRLNWDSFD